jgi:hypothetical protein
VAERVEKFALVAAAGASGAFQTHAFLDGVVTRLELYVPAGHAGLTSWAFYFGTAQLIPKTAGATIVADDEQFEWDLENVPTGTGYQSKYSNTDAIAHTFHIQVWLEEFSAGADESGDLPVLIVPLAV